MLHLSYGLWAYYWHVGQNIRRRYKKFVLIRIYQKAIKAYYVEDFSIYFGKIRQTYPKVASYLEKDVTLKKKSRAHFSGNRYEDMTSNIVEIMNGMMQKTRMYLITTMIDFILNTMRQWFLNWCWKTYAVTTPLTHKRE